jgi:hypothetical protein
VAQFGSGFQHSPFNDMRVVLLFVTVAVLGLRTNVSAASATNTVSTNDVLVIDRCFTSVAGGKCTLSIGPLRPVGDLYCGDYATKISPYFFKNEDGKLAILITRESIEKACRGLSVDITGTATEKGKARKSRHIDAAATPLDCRQGTLKLRFLADGREMVFDTRYKFVAPE